VKPYCQDNLIEFYNGDARNMSELPDESVQCVVTSPPYWGLRKYAGAQDMIWGGDDKCEHRWVGKGLISDRRGLEVIQGKSRTTTRHYGDDPTKTWSEEHQKHRQDNFCSLCGAWKGQYGLEPTPEMYIEHTLVFLREIRRVLRKDGVVFWNIGDSYNSKEPSSGRTFRRDRAKVMPGIERGKRIPRGSGRWGGGNNYALGLKPKDLCLIPFRVAIAAQEDGWWVRSVIIWSKPNPMPESVTDRPTKSHEYILMLTKSGRPVYWAHQDGGGTRKRPRADYRWVNQLTEEEVTEEPPDWKAKITCPDCGGTGNVEKEIGWYDYEEKCPTCGGEGEATPWRRINLWKGHDYFWDAEAVREPSKPGANGKVAVRPSGDSRTRDKENWGVPHEMKQVVRSYERICGPNIRSVWEFPTKPYPEAHFAVFPEKLPELCIKAATPEAGCCSKCGAPWGREIEKTGHINKREAAHVPNNAPTKTDSTGWAPVTTATNNWQPTCECGAPRVPSLVLDLFMGCGTTLWVAKKLGRRAVGYELPEEYCRLALERSRQMAMELV